MEEKIRILVVDDQKNAGYCVKCAIDDIMAEMKLPGEVLLETNPMRALRTVCNSNIDLLLSGLHLPQMDGEQLIEMINVICPSTVVMLMSEGLNGFYSRCDGVTVVGKASDEESLKKALLSSLGVEL